MSILAQVQQIREARARPGTMSVKALPISWPAWREGRPAWKLIDYQAYVTDGFNLNTLVYSAIMYKVRAMTLAPLRAWTGTYEQREPLDEGEPLAQLVARPNPHQSWKEFQGQGIVYLNISGNNFTLLDRKRQGRLPEAMYDLRPDRVFVVPGTVEDRATVLGYLYVPEGKIAFLKWDEAQRRAAWNENRVFPILPTDMMHVKMPNPGDPLEGMGEGLSPMSPEARSIDVDNAVTHFLKLFFDKGIVVPGMITIEGSADDDAIARAKERWKEIYGGYENWAEEIFVSDRSAKYTRVGLTFDEMGFEGIDERNESRILSPFGVPPILVGARVGLTRSSYGKAYEEARRAFWEDTMMSESGWFEAEYKYYLQDGDAFVAYDYSKVPALQQNIPLLAEAAHVLWTMGIPANQATEQVGLNLGDIPGGDVAYVPMGMIAMGMSVEPEPTEEGVPEAEDDTRKLLSGKKKGVSRSRRGGLTYRQKQAMHRKVDSIATKWEPKFAKAAAKALRRDKRELVKRMRVKRAPPQVGEKKAEVEWTVIQREWDEYFERFVGEEWRQEFMPLVEGLVTEQGESWNTTLGMQFNVRNYLAEAWLEDYMLTFAQDINDTTKRDVSSILLDAMQQGWGIDKMNKGLGLLFDKYINDKKVDCSRDDLSQEEQWFCDRQPKYRRENISRTETMRAANSGSHSLFGAYGAQKKEWWGSGDDRMRLSHLMAWQNYSEGGTPGPILLNQPFIVGGARLMYPGDPSGPAEEVCQCRCTELPYMDTWAGTEEEIAAARADMDAEVVRREAEVAEESIAES